MKTKQLILIAVMMMAATSLFAQNKKTEEFKVYGKCGMCETRIEKAADAVPGVVSSAWDQKAQTLKVTYKANKVKRSDIHKAVAKVGHDTDVVRADDKVYDALHGCCHYARPEKKK